MGDGTRLGVDVNVIVGLGVRVSVCEAVRGMAGDEGMVAVGVRLATGVVGDTDVLVG